MKNILMITFWGNMFLFNNDLSEEESVSLQSIADSDQFRKIIDFKDHSGILEKFLKAVETDLDISLEPAKISHIIRIK